MRKLYITPEANIVELTLKDVILSSPTEGDVPIGGGGDTSEPEIELGGGDGL